MSEEFVDFMRKSEVTFSFKIKNVSNFLEGVLTIGNAKSNT
jgi:hypothetical protein